MSGLSNADDWNVTRHELLSSDCVAPETAADGGLLMAVIVREWETKERRYHRSCLRFESHVSAIIDLLRQVAGTPGCVDHGDSSTVRNARWTKADTEFEAELDDMLWNLRNLADKCRARILAKRDRNGTVPLVLRSYLGLFNQVVGELGHARSSRVFTYRGVRGSVERMLSLIASHSRSRCDEALSECDDINEVLRTAEQGLDALRQTFREMIGSRAKDSQGGEAGGTAGSPIAHDASDDVPFSTFLDRFDHQTRCAGMLCESRVTKRLRDAAIVGIENAHDVFATDLVRIGGLREDSRVTAAINQLVVLSKMLSTYVGRIGASPILLLGRAFHTTTPEDVSRQYRTILSLLGSRSARDPLVGLDARGDPARVPFRRIPSFRSAVAADLKGPVFSVFPGADETDDRGDSSPDFGSDSESEPDHPRWLN